MSLLDIARYTRAIDACILQLKEYTYLVMLSSMKFFFLMLIFVKENHLHIPIEMVLLLTLDTRCETPKKKKSTKQALEVEHNQPTNQVNVSSKTWSTTTTHVPLIIQLKSKLFLKTHPHKENNLVMKETYSRAIG